MLTAEYFEQGLVAHEARSTALPEISVIMPVSLAGLRQPADRAIAAVLAQAGPSLELILIDDGSPEDRAGELLEWHRRDDRVTVLRYPRHAGLPALRLNRGIERARGRFIAYQLPHTAYRPGALAALLDAAADDEDVLCHGAVAFLPDGSADEAVAAEPDIAVLGGQPLVPGGLLAENRIAFAGVLHGRRLIDRVGGFDPHVAMQGLFDWDLWWRLSNVATIRHLPAIVADAVGRGICDAAPLSLVEEMFRWRRQFAGRALTEYGDIDLLSLTDVPLKQDRDTIYRSLLLPFIARTLPADDLLLTALNEAVLADEALVIRTAGGTSPSHEITLRNFSRIYRNIHVEYFGGHRFSFPSGEDFTLVNFRQSKSPFTDLRNMARRARVPVVHLMDDDLLNVAILPGREITWRADGPNHVNIRAQLRDADYAIVYADTLARLVREYTPRVTALRTNVEACRIPATAPRVVDGMRTYCILSRYPRHGELAEVAAEIREFFTRHREVARLVVICTAESRQAYRDELAGIDFEFRDALRFERYMDELPTLGIDFVLNLQRADEIFYHSKSPVKFIEATIAGAILLTSDVPPYAPVDPAAALKVPWAPGAWQAALDASLAFTVEERQARLAQARRHLAQHYTTESQYFLFMATYRVAALHAALLSRRAPEGRARILMEGPDGQVRGFARLLAAWHFEVVRPPRMLAPEMSAWLVEQRVALVHAHGWTSPWVAAGKAAGLPSVATCFPPFEACNPVVTGLHNAPDLALSLSLGDWYGLWRGTNEVPNRLVALPKDRNGAAPAQVATDGTCRIAVIAEEGKMELSAAVIAGAVRALSGRFGPLAMVLPFSAADGLAWARRWAKRTDGITMSFHDPHDSTTGVAALISGADMLCAVGEGHLVFQAKLRAMALGIPVLAFAPGADGGLIASGFNGLSAETLEDGVASDLIEAGLTWAPARRAAILAQARGTAEAWAGDLPCITRLVSSYLEAVAEWGRRQVQASRQALEGRRVRRSISVVLPPGQRVRFLGFRTTDPMGPEILASAIPPDWRYADGSGASLALVGGGTRPQTATFEIEADDLLIGFEASRREARLSLIVDGVARDLVFTRVCWHPVS